MSEIIKCPKTAVYMLLMGMKAGGRIQADAADQLDKALEEVFAQLEDALEWYGEKAKAMKRYASAKPPQTISMTAVVTELSLDGGNRALVALGGEL